jgi:hypothetical protein
MADKGPPRLHGFPADKRPGEIPSIACLSGAQRGVHPLSYLENNHGVMAIMVKPAPTRPFRLQEMRMPVFHRNVRPCMQGPYSVPA